MIDAEMPMMMMEGVIELTDSFITPAENKRNTKNFRKKVNKRNPNLKSDLVGRPYK